MTKSFKTILAIVALATSATLFAQPVRTVADDDGGQGVIGKRYVEAGLGFQNVDDTEDNRWVAGVAGNLPLTSFLDVGGSYSRRWMESHGDLSSDVLNSSVTWFNVIEDDMKPFLSAGLGFRRDGFPTRTAGSTPSTSYGIWSVSVGAEFPYQWISVTPTITYNDDLRNSQDSRQSLDYGVCIDSWATSRIGVYVKAAYTDSRHYGDNAWFFGAGVRVKL